MERNVEVATGESVAFTYELAGLGSRFVAMFLDFSIQIAVTLVLVALLAWVESALPAGSKTAFFKWASSLVAALGFALLFVIFFGYFVLFEWISGGRTPGKRVLGIRVVRDGGFAVDFVSSAIRNLVRVLEFGLGFYTLSAIVVLISPRSQRLGDMVAGTLVVRDNRYERTASSLVERSDRDDTLVRELSPQERELIRRYYARRPGLGLEARTNVAGHIAARIRPKLAVPFDHIDDDHLLVHLATTALSP